MKWRKIGNIFVLNKKLKWMQSHASNVVAENIKDGIFRIYFSTRDLNNRASIGFVDVDFGNSFEILRISKKPVISFGKIGLFDDSGTSLSCINQINGKRYLYYLGWNLGLNVPWRNSIGLAIYDENNDVFIKYSDAPIVDRDYIDPYSISYPFVLKEKNKYKMWYGSNLNWGKEQKDMAHVIKYAESKDGINWKKNGNIAIGFEKKNEYAISRPFVIKEHDIYKMWYSYRGKSYRIGYAESNDGYNWVRKDKNVGISISKSGWDSEMICYPFIVDFNGKRYMLYNGNGYGKTGFGIAVLEKD